MSISGAALLYVDLGLRARGFIPTGDNSWRGPNGETYFPHRSFESDVIDLAERAIQDFLERHEAQGCNNAPPQIAGFPAGDSPKTPTGSRRQDRGHADPGSSSQGT